MSKTNLYKLHATRAGIRSTISMFIKTAEESKEQLNIAQFNLAVEELEMKTKTLYELNEKIMSATDAEHIEEEIVSTEKNSFELKVKLMGLRTFQREMAANNSNVNRNAQNGHCGNGRLSEQTGHGGVDSTQNNVAWIDANADGSHSDVAVCVECDVGIQTENHQQAVDLNCQHFASGSQNVTGSTNPVMALPSDQPIPYIVIDNGSFMCKAGFCTEDASIVIYPSVIERPKYGQRMANLKTWDTYIGDIAQKRKTIFSLNYPVERGVVTNWDDMEKMWHHTLCNELYASPLEHEVSLTESPLNQLTNRETIAEILLETFNVHGFQFCLHAILTMYASGRNCGVVTDCGDSVTQVLDIKEGNYSISSAVSHMDLAGIDLTNSLTKFIPEKAPWYGGWWELLIGLTKQTLKKILGRALVDLETLQTVVSEVESILNDRPLTYVSSSLDDPEPLTPSHLLTGRKIRSLPHLRAEIDHEHLLSDRNDISKRARNQSRLIDQFWRRWKTEYLTALRERNSKIGSNSQVIRVGEDVQVYDDSHRIRWKLAVIESLIYGNDGLVRAAKVKMANGLIATRPIVKLYQLEVIDT